MKRVITGILAMLIVLPALEITSGINGATASLPLGGLEMLHMQALTGGTNASAFDSSLKVGPVLPLVGQLHMGEGFKHSGGPNMGEQPPHSPACCLADTSTGDQHAAVLSFVNKDICYDGHPCTCAHVPATRPGVPA